MSTLLGPGLPIDIDRLVSTRLLVNASSGAGKSWCLRRLLEQTHGHVQQLVIDPEGEFATLRERFDYVLAAPKGGDVAADPRSAAVLAERLLELRVSAILDIYELKPRDRIAFVQHFCAALVNAPKTLWHPVLVVLDEAHAYAPEAGDAASADAVSDLATRGRKRGFCLLAATQRLAMLSKDVAAQCNNVLTGRTTLDTDVKRAAYTLGFTTAAEKRRLHELEDGEFFAFGPAFSRTVTKVHVGPVQTTHPKAGGKQHAFTPPPPTAMVKAALSKLADLPAEVEAREKTVADLQAELATAKRELAVAKRAAPAAPAVETKVERVEVPIITEAVVAGIRDQVARMEEIANGLRIHGEGVASSAASMMSAAKAMADGLRDTVAVIAKVDRLVSDAEARATRTAVPAPRPAPARALPRPSANGGDPKLGTGERKLLTALAQYPDGRTRTQVAILTGYSSGGGRFSNLLSALRSAGYLTGDDPVRITDTGVDALGTWEPLPVGDELLDHWRGKLGSGERRVLDAIVAAYPDRLSRSAIAAAAEYEEGGGRFSNILSYLRTLELIEGRTEIRASEALFG